jgi:hypothetical protein
MNTSSIYISHGSVFCREHIGSVFYFISTHCIAKKFFAIKHSNTLVSLLSKNVHVLLDNSLFHIYRTYTSDTFFLRVYELSLDFNIRFLERSILLEYGFFSQVEWRYIRYSFFQLWFSATVVHSGFYDFNLRNYAVFRNLVNIRHGHLLVLSSACKNISTSSFFISVFYLAVFLSRSRTDENTYEDDFFFTDLNCEDVLDSYILDNVSYIGHDSDHVDVDFDSHYSVEEQLNISGFFFDNNLCSMSSFSEYMSFSYLHFYTQLLSVYNTFATFFMYRSFLYLFFFSFFIYIKTVLLFKKSTYLTLTYFFSDYLF